jgi:hypothetical protein
LAQKSRCHSITRLFTLPGRHFSDFLWFFSFPNMVRGFFWLCTVESSG